MPLLHSFPGSRVFDANATDSDTGLHGQLEYSITGGLNGGIDFSMDLQEGRVFVGAELDRETRDLYVLNLTVKDRALKESDRRSTTMEVSVLKKKTSQQNANKFDFKSHHYEPPKITIHIDLRYWFPCGENSDMKKAGMFFRNFELNP